MSTVPPDQISSLARSLGRNPAVRRIRALLIARRSSEAVMVALAAVVGLVTGLLAVALIMLVEAVQEVSFGSLPDVPAVLLMPALGGLVVGLLTWKAVPEARGSGISSVMMAIAVRGGRIRPIVGPGKLVASAVSLGTGASGGREGPIVQIGASVASSIGRFFALDEERLRSLIAASAAGAMAASYNAPIGGMLFAIEVIVGGFNIRSLQTIVVSAVIASVTARQIIGEALIYNPPQYTLVHPWELGLYAGLGLLAVAVGIGFSRLEQLVEQATRHLRVPHPLVTAGGALMVGAIALAVPEVLGSGDRLPDVLGVNTEPVAAMLDGEFSLQFLLLLLFAKMLASGIALGTGSAVGSFTPLIVLGAALGGAYGQVAAMVLPVEGLNPGAYALVGTAGVVAAGAHAPLTGVLLVFELTGSYELVLPLMLTTGLATFISERVTTGSLYTRPLLEAGVVYAEPEDVDIMQTVRVGEIMSTGVETIGPRQSVAHLREALRRSRHHGMAVVDERDPGDPRLVGIVTLTDLAGTVGSSTGDLAAERHIAVEEICTRQPLTVTPDDPVFRALRRMASIDVGRLPVVAPEDHGRFVGLVRRADVVKAYQRAVTRGLGAQQRQASSRLRNLAGATFVELIVREGAPVAGRAVREVSWPTRTILTSIRRGGDLVLPSGDTVLEIGDEVVVLTDSDTTADVRGLIAGESQPRAST